MSDAPEEDGPVIRDRRRLDPMTGEVRVGIGRDLTPDEPLDAEAVAGPVAELEAQIAERTADLQRLQAEYANYRRRVERDRQAVGEAALASVFANLLPVLDDIDRARSHDEVSGGFARVADGLDAALTKLGLERFGAAGEPFDPTLHEALTHGFSNEVTEPVCAEVLQTGYRVGERVLRPARVAVLEPEPVARDDAELGPEFEAQFAGDTEPASDDDGTE